jgi:hypothetical protein
MIKDSQIHLLCYSVSLIYYPSYMFGLSGYLEGISSSLTLAKVFAIKFEFDTTWQRHWKIVVKQTKKETQYSWSQ